MRIPHSELISAREHGCFLVCSFQLNNPEKPRVSTHGQISVVVEVFPRSAAREFAKRQRVSGEFAWPIRITIETELRKRSFYFQNSIFGIRRKVCHTRHRFGDQYVFHIRMYTRLIRLSTHHGYFTELSTLTLEKATFFLNSRFFSSFIFWL